MFSKSYLGHLICVLFYDIYTSTIWKTEHKYAPLMINATDCVWGSVKFYIIRVVSFILMVICEDSPDDSSIRRARLREELILYSAVKEAGRRSVYYDCKVFVLSWALNRALIFYILLTECTWLQLVLAEGIRHCTYDIDIEPYQDRSRCWDLCLG